MWRWNLADYHNLMRTPLVWFCLHVCNATITTSTNNKIQCFLSPPSYPSFPSFLLSFFCFPSVPSALLPLTFPSVQTSVGPTSNGRSFGPSPAFCMPLLQVGVGILVWTGYPAIGTATGNKEEKKKKQRRKGNQWKHGCSAYCGCVILPVTTTTGVGDLVLLFMFVFSTNLFSDLVLSRLLLFVSGDILYYEFDFILPILHLLR